MKGGFIALLFMAIGVFAPLYHNTKLEEARIAGYAQAVKECEDRMQEIKQEYYDQGYLDGEYDANIKCEDEKKEVYTVGYQKGQTFGEKTAKLYYNAEIKRLEQDFAEQLNYERALRVMWRDSVQRLEQKFSEQVTIQTRNDKLESSVKQKALSANYQVNNNVIKVLLVFVSITAIPFFAAMGLGKIYKKRYF